MWERDLIIWSEGTCPRPNVLIFIFDVTENYRSESLEPYNEDVIRQPVFTNVRVGSRLVTTLFEMKNYSIHCTNISLSFLRTVDKPSDHLKKDISLSIIPKSRNYRCIPQTPYQTEERGNIVTKVLHVWCKSGRLHQTTGYENWYIFWMDQEESYKTE